MFRVVLTDTQGMRYPSQPFNDEAGARQLYDRPLSGRFVRAELWTGEIERGEWVDGGELASKP